MPTTWSEWVRDQITRRHWDQADAARAAGLPRSAISQWLNTDSRPTVENLRKFAAAVDMPIVRALVIAGYITAEEAGMTTHERTAQDLTHDELLREVAERLAAMERGSRQLPPIPQTEVTWPSTAAPSGRRPSEPQTPESKRSSQ